MKVRNAEQYNAQMRARHARATLVPQPAKASRKVPRAGEGSKPNHAARAIPVMAAFTRDSRYLCDSRTKAQKQADAFHEGIANGR